MPIRLWSLQAAASSVEGWTPSQVEPGPHYSSHQEAACRHCKMNQRHGQLMAAARPARPMRDPGKFQSRLHCENKGREGLPPPRVAGRIAPSKVGSEALPPHPSKRGGTELVKWAAVNGILAQGEPTAAPTRSARHPRGATPKATRRAAARAADKRAKAGSRSRSAQGSTAHAVGQRVVLAEYADPLV